jgi:hypothetical protein|tara:strand:- start:467 stop:616 length:150 start_codon:yes stop_codon:yes gene_type:complete
MNGSKKIDLFSLFNKNECDYLFQQLAEKLTDKGIDPNNIEIIFEGEIIK